LKFDIGHLCAQTLVGDSKQKSLHWTAFKHIREAYGFRDKDFFKLKILVSVQKVVKPLVEHIESVACWIALPVPALAASYESC
jgi:hypothetical protein